MSPWNEDVLVTIMRTAIVLVFVCTVAVGVASAQQASRSTFVKLMDVQELWEEEKYDAALAELDELLAKTRNKPYDYALANQYLAHTCVLADCPERTRSALEAALAQPGLPDSLLITLKLFYGQVLLVDEEFVEARDTFEQWLTLLARTEGVADPAQLFSAAYANFQTDRYERAAELLDVAISRKPNSPPSWRQLQYHTLFELKRFAEAESVALDLVTRGLDDKTAWQLLSNHYLRLEEGAMALAVMTTAYQQSVLDSPTDLKRIVSLYSVLEVPERAARLMEMMLQQAIVDADYESLKLLGELWLIARERESAVIALAAAAELAPDGDTDELVGNIHFEDERWRPALEAFERSIDKSEDSANERLHLLAGISAARAGLAAAARTHLKIAMTHDKYRSQARGVLRELDDS